MSTDNKIWELAEAYVSGTLAEAELISLQNNVNTDPTFASQFQECVNLLQSLNGSGNQKRFRSTLQEIQVEHTEANKPAKQVTRTISLRAYYWRTGAVAAGIALLTFFCTYWTINPKKSASQYNVLRGEIENIKRSQNQLIQNIKAQKAPSTVPVAQVKYTGTGFALTNKGYLVTNYHVVDGADSVYIQNHNGDYYKASVAAFDENTDIAILKVEDEDFTFGKGDVPYTFVGAKAEIGEHVFTLGWPNGEIVYNEGYISARNGFEGDSLQYSLVLPAHPGQSGAPILDANGNILAIVTARGNQNDGNTYAVSSNALLQLLHSLNKELNIHLPKANKLKNLTAEQRIAKLEYYTCSVKVYKK
ncbi:MAG TPA: S1C family serine protease [Flavipsychrobacter sp.]|nr:S1C family serine protease [Flavipsychrobacter sp.]